MFAFELSFFGTALMIIVVVLVVLYLLVLIKLRPSTEGKEVSFKKEVMEQRNLEETLNEQQFETAIYNEFEEEPIETVEKQEKMEPVETIEPIETVEKQENIEPVETIEPIERQEIVSPAPVETEKASVNGCPHYFGYLGKHPKNTPLPNECLTCTRIMECLSKVE